MELDVEAKPTRGRRRSANAKISIDASVLDSLCLLDMWAPEYHCTCLDGAWVKSMKVANQERDVRGRLVYPFLQPALKYPRHQAASVYADACIPDGAFIYGVGEVDTLLMFWKAILLCLGLYISFLIRNVSADFQEWPWIFGLAVVVFIGTVVILPLAYLVDMAVAAFYIFLACSFLVGTSFIMGFMLVPKLFLLNEVSRSSDHTINLMNRIASKRGSATILDIQQFNATEAGTSIQSSTQMRPRAIKYNVAPSISRYGSM